MEQLTLMQHEITQLLEKGGFTVKIWEKSGEIGETYFLGVTWTKDQDKYKLKFIFNLSKRYRGTHLKKILQWRIWETRPTS